MLFVRGRGCGGLRGWGWECVGCLFSIVCNDVDGGFMFAKLGFLFLLLSVPGGLNWFASNTMLSKHAAFLGGGATASRPGLHIF